jgi:hypothetical protein
MAKVAKTGKAIKNNKKEVKAEILGKLSDAMKEYKTPASEKKLAKKLKKATKEITPLVLKTKAKKATAADKKKE